MPLLISFIGSNMKVADLVFENIKPLFKDDIHLIEVEYVKRNDGMHLIVYIDKEGGVTIDDCVKVNDMINQTIDDLNPTNDSPYVLDVSYDQQFKKNENKKVNVKLYQKVDGRKEFVATLLGKNEKEFTFNIDNENFTINTADVAYITPYIEF